MNVTVTWALVAFAALSFASAPATAHGDADHAKKAGAVLKE